MIIIKSPREIELMKEAGKVVGRVFDEIGEMCKEGVSTLEIASKAEQVIRSFGAKPTFKGYGGFKGAICVSVNDEIIHGIPSHRKLKNGDIVSCDVGATLNGYVGDACRTFFVGEVKENAKRLVKVTEECFFKAIELVKPGVRLSTISHAVQVHAESNGYSVLKDFTGHGIGRNLHEDPSIPNYGEEGHGPTLKKGMCLCIEPMIMEGSDEYIVLEDGWTVKTKDHKLSSHYENTIVVTEDGCQILTFGNKEVSHG